MGGRGMGGRGGGLSRLARTGLVAAALGGAGATAAAPIDLAIPDIQGTGQRSAYVDQHVRTTGVVTATAANGFYLQDSMGDGDPNTSDAVFVFTGGASVPDGVAAGDRLRVPGGVGEFQPGGAAARNLPTTQLLGQPDRPLAVEAVLSRGEVLPAPVVLGAGGRAPPTAEIAAPGLTAYDPARYGIDLYESLEAMRVTVSDAVAVGPTNRFDESYALGEGGAGATGRNARGGITVAPGDFNPERVQIQMNPAVQSGVPQLDVGDRLGDVTGVLGYGFSPFEVRQAEPFSPAGGGLQRELTTLAGDAGHLTVTSFNVENLAPSSPTLPRIAQRIAGNLGGPDLVALQGVQDNSGPMDDGVVTADVTLRTLANRIRDAGGPAYAFIDNPPQDTHDGGQPGGNIRVAYLYNPDRVRLAHVQRITHPDAAPGDDGTFQNSRKPLRATFVFNGQRVTLIDNHFTSKGGSSPLFGLVQPPIDGGADRRLAQGRVVRAIVDGLLTDDDLGNDRVVVLGDLNEFRFDPAVDALRSGPGGPLTDLHDLLPPRERYSYIFEGNSQTLDHLLHSRLLAPGALFAVVRINAEFADQTSDHDPLLARFRIPGPAVAVPEPAGLAPLAARLAVLGALRCSRCRRPRARP